MFGFINVNKPDGITSHGAVSILRKITGIKQIGHSGTLDPAACGVLPIAIGKAAKLIDFLDGDKSYKTGLYLGKISDTFDMQGSVKETGYRKIEKNEVIEALKYFRGNIIQTPPAFSAVHYNGKRLYELARNGKIPDDIPKRKVTVYENEIIDFDYEKQILRLNITCSKGTYIRSIVNDMGILLKSGAVMFELIRTKSSGFLIENSITINENTPLEYIQKSLINPVDVLNLANMEISGDDCFKKLLNGSRFRNNTSYSGNVLIVKDGRAIALGIADKEYVYPKKVLL